MSNGKNTTYQNSSKAAKCEIMTLNHHAKQSKTEIQWSMHPFFHFHRGKEQLKENSGEEKEKKTHKRKINTIKTTTQ